ncbi:hypothetical protein PDR5_11130 [Pseudomonas sp. DR 5-09]|nr:hypothetical protein PDR5_11130 [Pseudomonas sp. DR 5-09]
MCQRVLKRSFQAWLPVPTEGIFQKFRKDGPSPKKTLTERTGL